MSRNDFNNEVIAILAARGVNASNDVDFITVDLPTAGECLAIAINDGEWTYNHFAEEGMDVIDDQAENPTCSRAATPVIVATFIERIYRHHCAA